MSLRLRFLLLENIKSETEDLRQVMSRRNSRVIDTQPKQIDAIFRAQSADPPVVKLFDVEKNKNCDVHSMHSARRGSVDSTQNLSRKGSTASNFEAKRNSYCSTE